MLNIAKITESHCSKCWAFHFCGGCIRDTFDGSGIPSAQKRLSKCYSYRAMGDVILYGAVMLREIPLYYREQLQEATKWSNKNESLLECIWGAQTPFHCSNILTNYKTDMQYILLLQQKQSMNISIERHCFWMIGCQTFLHWQYFARSSYHHHPFYLSIPTFFTIRYLRSSFL